MWKLVILWFNWYALACEDTQVFHNSSTRLLWNRRNLCVCLGICFSATNGCLPSAVCVDRWTPDRAATTWTRPFSCARTSPIASSTITSGCRSATAPTSLSSLERSVSASASPRSFSPWSLTPCSIKISRSSQSARLSSPSAQSPSPGRISTTVSWAASLLFLLCFSSLYSSQSQGGNKRRRFCVACRVRCRVGARILHGRWSLCVSPAQRSSRFSTQCNGVKWNPPIGW